MRLKINVMKRVKKLGIWMAGENETDGGTCGWFCLGLIAVLDRPLLRPRPAHLTLSPPLAFPPQQPSSPLLPAASLYL